MFALAMVLAVLVGIALGLLGGGGSILTLLILRYVLGLEVHQAVAVSLLVVSVTSVFALVPHARRGRVRWRTGALFGATGMVGAYGTGRLSAGIPPGVLLGLFGVMMLVTAAAMLRGRGRALAARRAAPELPVGQALALGLAVGAVTGLVGAGGGFVVVPALVLLGGLSMEIAVGTSLVVITMNTVAGLGGYLLSTPVPWSLALPVTAAAVGGSLAGSALVGRVPPERLRRVFAWFLVAMAVFVLTRELR
jgi:uncharacterized membrane protein YfcA